MIKEEDGKYHVYSEDGKKHLGGPYGTKDEALTRLREIEYFKSHPKKKSRLCYSFLYEMSHVSQSASRQTASLPRMSTPT